MVKNDLHNESELLPASLGNNLKKSYGDQEGGLQWDLNPRLSVRTDILDH